jgi:hypothetical protein
MLSNLDHKYSCWLPLCWRNHFSYRRYCNRLDFRCWEMWELGCALNLVSFKTHFTFFWSFFITCKETNGIFLPVLMFSTMFLGGHFSTAWLGTPLYSTGNIHHTLVSCRSISFIMGKEFTREEAVWMETLFRSMAIWFWSWLPPLNMVNICHLCIIVLHGSHTTLGKPDAEAGFIFVTVCSVLELCKCLYKLDNFLRIW